MTDSRSNDVTLCRRLDIVFNRPTRKNALTDEMYRTVVAALEQAESAKNVKVVVLSCEGGDFSAGHDLEGFLSEPRCLRS
ncbi:enoyl-CoA hydratase/isomerase family protein [Burkholderia sp. BCC1996]|uniref:enoyl-CoA hydratase/isomerase family protein n=1 Tax=unclassified Burkholderia TaxID=2613784 RepID=UPI0039F066AF